MDSNIWIVLLLAVIQSTIRLLRKKWVWKPPEIEIRLIIIQDYKVDLQDISSSSVTLGFDNVTISGATVPALPQRQLTRTWDRQHIASRGSDRQAQLSLQATERGGAPWETPLSSRASLNICIARFVNTTRPNLPFNQTEQDAHPHPHPLYPSRGNTNKQSAIAGKLDPRSTQMIYQCRPVQARARVSHDLLDSSV